MKFCTNCARPIQTNVNYCTSCGAPQEVSFESKQPVVPIMPIPTPQSSEQLFSPCPTPSEQPASPYSTPSEQPFLPSGQWQDQLQSEPTQSLSNTELPQVIAPDRQMEMESFSHTYSDYPHAPQKKKFFDSDGKIIAAVVLGAVLFLAIFILLNGAV